MLDLETLEAYDNMVMVMVVVGMKDPSHEFEILK